MIEGDRKDAASVCQHHGHFEVSAVPPSPACDGKGVSRIECFKQGVSDGHWK